MPDSVRAYVRDAMTIFRANSLHQAEVNWSALEDSVISRSGNAQTPDGTWRALTWALRSVDPHSFLMPPPSKMATMLGGIAAPSRAASAAPSSPVTAQLLDGHVAYVTVPPHSGANRPAYVDSLHAQLGALDRGAICGWIVDLRDDSGGNMWPMLAGIGPLLGAEAVGSFTNSRPGAAWRYRDGRSWSGDSTFPAEFAGWGTTPAPKLTHADAPVALLIGHRTASSGEMTVLAFLGRAQVRSFGDSTAGFTSSNTTVPLRDGATLIVTSSYPRDRLGRTYPLRIAPDELVPAVRGAADDDATVKAAVAWLRRHQACSMRSPPSAADAQDAFKWTLAGSQPSAYVMTADGSPMTEPGATLTLRSTASTVSGSGTAASTMRVDTLAGRRVRISADIETRDVSTSASVWLRVDSAGKMLALDNGFDQGIKGTTTASRHMDVTVFVPNSATTLLLGLLLVGPGEATARNVRIIARPVVSANTPLAPEAQRELDSAFAIVHRGSLWRDTVTWSRVDPEVRAMAAGSETAADTHAAIRALLARLGDHHSFLMKPQGAAAFRTGGAENPRPLVRVQTAGIGYISVPAYSGIDKAAAESYVRAVHDSLAHAVTNGAGTCRWILDLRTNGGGNMWPMLGGLRPFVGDAGLGSFVSAMGSGPLWHARDQVDVKPPATLAPLESANVAVLTGPATASSGEAVTISFIGRPRTRTFGLPTAGLSTANATIMLPDSAMILLTTAVEADRTGKRYGEQLTPDELIPAAASGATADPQMVRAVAWLTSQACK